MWELTVSPPYSAGPCYNIADTDMNFQAIILKYTIIKESEFGQQFIALKTCGVKCLELYILKIQDGSLGS